MGMSYYTSTASSSTAYISPSPPKFPFDLKELKIELAKQLIKEKTVKKRKKEKFYFDPENLDV